MKPAPLHLPLHPCTQPPSGGCVLKRIDDAAQPEIQFQPPSGGCVLKHLNAKDKKLEATQPPSGGCVLKQRQKEAVDKTGAQPPSGGCVLKPITGNKQKRNHQSAAFGRLCVETQNNRCVFACKCSAAFGRLCVETPLRNTSSHKSHCQPPSGGCVLKRRLL